MTPEAIAAVEATVKENRRTTMNELAAHLDMSHGSATISSMIKNEEHLKFSFDSPSYEDIEM